MTRRLLVLDQVPTPGAAPTPPGGASAIGHRMLGWRVGTARPIPPFRLSFRRSSRNAGAWSDTGCRGSRDDDPDRRGGLWNGCRDGCCAKSQRTIRVILPSSIKRPH